MPRIVPTRVCAFIEDVFPLKYSKSEKAEHQIPKESGTDLAVLLALVDRIPDELVTLVGADYSEYIMCVETIRHQLSLWHTQADPTHLRKIHGKNIIGLIHEALSKCPDEAPSQGTVELAYVTDQMLRESIRLDISSAHQNLIAGEWKGAIVLAGAATEALLLWAVDEEDRKSPGSIKKITATMKPKPSNDREEWGLFDLIRVAELAGLIDGETVTQAMLGKDFRNLIHAGRAKRTNKTADQARAFGAFAAVQAVARDLSP